MKMYKPQKKLMDMLREHNLDIISCCCVEPNTYKFKNSDGWFKFSSKNLDNETIRYLKSKESHTYSPYVLDDMLYSINILKNEKE